MKNKWLLLLNLEINKFFMENWTVVRFKFSWQKRQIRYRASAALWSTQRNLGYQAGDPTCPALVAYVLCSLVAVQRSAVLFCWKWVYYQLHLKHTLQISLGHYKLGQISFWKVVVIKNLPSATQAWCLLRKSYLKFENWYIYGMPP